MSSEVNEKILAEKIESKLLKCYLWVDSLNMDDEKVRELADQWWNIVDETTPHQELWDDMCFASSIFIQWHRKKEKNDEHNG